MPVGVRDERFDLFRPGGERCAGDCSRHYRSHLVVVVVHKPPYDRHREPVVTVRLGEQAVRECCSYPPIRVRREGLKPAVRRHAME